MLLAIEGELVGQQLIHRRLAVGRLFLPEHKDEELVERVVVGPVHELPNRELHLFECRRRRYLEGHAVMIVAKIDAGEVLLLPVQINEVREVVDRFQMGMKASSSARLMSVRPWEVANST